VIRVRFQDTEAFVLEEKKRNTNIGIGVGILLQLVYRILGPGFGVIGSLIGLIGLGFFIWGCANYSEGKGHSKWLGFLGLLSIIGLIVLMFLPDKHKAT
jgi:hypothetical protein